MKKYILCAFALCTINGFAQEVLISHPDYPASHLTLNGNNKGFHLPNVHLQDLSSPAPLSSVEEGMMVYNTNPVLRTGIYMYIGDKWVRSGENADYFIIKDIPQKETIETTYKLTTVSNAKDTYTYDNIENIRNLTLNIVASPTTSPDEDDEDIKCFNNYSISSSFYCVYRTNREINWEEAYKAAKLSGGYLVTISNDKEQEYIQNILDQNNITTNIWLGHRKVNHRNLASQENPLFTPYYYTLMGDNFSVEWGNRPKLFNNFIALEPNNNLGEEGCVLMLGKDLGTLNGENLTQHKWIDTKCNITNYSGTNPTTISNAGIKTLIIEYNY
jgi:Lectin C-type domain.